GLSATVMSRKDGQYRFANLRPGRYRIAWQTGRRFTYYGEERPSHAVLPVEVAEGRAAKGIDFQLAEIKKGAWTSYAISKGLANQSTLSLYRAPDHTLWIGTMSAGVFHFDGVELQSFSEDKGLSGSRVFCVEPAQDGGFWIGT